MTSKWFPRRGKVDAEETEMNVSEKATKAKATEAQAKGTREGRKREGTEKGEHREKDEQHKDEQPKRERRKDRTDTAGDTRAQSPAPGKNRRERDAQPSETGGGEKQGGIFSSFTKGKKEKVDASLADGTSVASEKRGRDEVPSTKADKKPRDRDISPGSTYAGSAVGTEAKVKRPGRKETGEPKVEEGTKLHKKETRMPTRDAGEGVRARKRTGEERQKEPGTSEKHDPPSEREHGRDRHHNRRDRPGQQHHETDARGAYGHRFFDPEELDEDTPCERCGQVQPHCKTCHQGLPRRKVLSRILGHEIDQSEEKTLEGPSCDECEQHIPLCEVCGLPLPPDILRERVQQRRRKEKLE